MDDLSPFEVVKAHLKEVCRCCLLKYDGMISFCPKTSVNSELIAMLSSVGNFEIEINEVLPSFICINCEEKLRKSYKFQQLVQKSNEIIKQCGSGKIEASQVQFDNQSVTTVSEIGDETQLEPNTRLPQYSACEVEKAIEESKEKFSSTNTCIKCSFISANLRALSLHISHVHKELKGRWCVHCNTEVDNLTEHKLSRNHEGLQCKFCGKTFRVKGHFTEHLLSHSNDRPFKCRVCDRGFISRRHLNKHVSVHLSKKPEKCVYCSKSFMFRCALESHLNSRHSQMVDVSESDVKREVSSNVKNFCKTCNKRVRSLYQHLKEVHSKSSVNVAEKDKVLCTICGQQFKTVAKLRLHMRVHTGETPYKCSYCGKRTPTRHQLVVHERTHTGEKPHVCKICNKSFGQSSVLNTHMKLHTGRSEMCDICSKTFCRPAQLRLHMRKHTGEKPYLCTECGQSFKQKSHLTEHSKTHSDERPFKCPVCGRGFKQNSSMKSHVQIHSGAKPFKCSQCSYACRQSYSLTQHMKQHSADMPRVDRPYNCDVCAKCFNTVAMLNSHKDMAHEVQL